MPMVINRAPRLTTIRHAKGRDPQSKKLITETVRLYPAGEAKEVSSEALQTKAVKAKLESGALEIVGAKTADQKSDGSDAKKSANQVNQGDSDKQTGKQGSKS